MNRRLILASKSPRRRELLKQLGLDFEVVPSKVTEDFVPEESPRSHALRLAEAKAEEVAMRYPNRWVVAADTIVSMDGSIFGKPKTQEEALGMLHRLSGQEHRVLTGFSVRHLEKGKRSGRKARCL